MGEASTSLADWLTLAANTLEGVEGASGLSLEARELAYRCVTGNRLVAVFGAFSAGKSSLINALLDDDVLTVSPNPTTATVTELRYSAQTEVSARCRLEFKSMDELFEDVKFSVAKIHRTASHLDGALKLAAELKLTDVPKSARRFLLFLKSVASGYEDARDKLGRTIDLPVGEAMKYTSEERLAGFVNRVQILHSSDVLKEGLTLVDTPGVDSIHKRHTNVAFDYMRKADAIVFVTYFTHAFSRADKDFLTQLAGVQDIVGRNKMQLVINAVDLAKDEEEQRAVRERIEAELRQSGLSAVPIYEVSSQLALLSRKLEGNPDNKEVTSLIRERLKLEGANPLPEASFVRASSGIPAFANGLTTLVATQSDELLSQAASRLRQSILDWLRNRKEMLSAQSTMSQLEAEELRERRKAVAKEFTAIRGECAAATADGWLSHSSGDLASVSHGLTGLLAEAQELIHHSGNRIQFDLAQMVREAFHPGRFVAGGQTRRLLEDSAEELATWLGRRWLVEQRNLVLRVGLLSRRIMNTAQASWQRKMNEVGISLSTTKEQSSSEWQDELLAACPEDDTLSAGRFERALRHFSSPKQFFEGTGQRDLLADVETEVRAWLTSSSETVVQNVLRAASRQLYAKLASFCRLAAEVAEREGEIPASSDELQSQLESISSTLQWFESNLTIS